MRAFGAVTRILFRFSCVVTVPLKQKALTAAKVAGVRGKDQTPFLLSHIKDITGLASLTSNIALVRHNAGVAADIAIAYAHQPGLRSSSGASRQTTGPGTGSVYGMFGASRSFHTHCSGSSLRGLSTGAGSGDVSGIPTGLPQGRTGGPVVVGGAVVDFMAMPKTDGKLVRGTSVPGVIKQAFGGTSVIPAFMAHDASYFHQTHRPIVHIIH